LYDNPTFIREKHSMRLLLISPPNPLVSIVHVKESRWNRYHGKFRFGSMA
jgi:hypothetical protein